MDTLEAIFTRRSVREYTDKKVEHEIVEKILKAAMYAPSATGQEPWQFIVVDERETLDQIAEIHPHGKMCFKAPLAIVPCLDTVLETHKGFGVQDLSNASQNILLAARALGLGAVWAGVFPRKERCEKLAKLFELPEHIIPFTVIAIGYSNVEQTEAPGRFKKDRIHHNKWSKK